MARRKRNKKGEPTIVIVVAEPKKVKRSIARDALKGLALISLWRGLRRRRGGKKKKRND